MYLVISKFENLRSVRDAARRAESGLGQLMKQSPGFQGYYVFDAGGGRCGSVTFFDTAENAVLANERALAWIRASLADLIDGEPDVTAGEVLAVVQP